MDRCASKWLGEVDTLDDAGIKSSGWERGLSSSRTIDALGEERRCGWEVKAVWQAEKRRFAGEVLGHSSDSGQITPFWVRRQHSADPLGNDFLLDRSIRNAVWGAPVSARLGRTLGDSAPGWCFHVEYCPVVCLSRKMPDINNRHQSNGVFSLEHLSYHVHAVRITLFRYQNRKNPSRQIFPELWLDRKVE